MIIAMLADDRNSTGFFPGRPGLKVHQGKWEILRLLGFGTRSSTWLVVDSHASDHFLALKILTCQATKSASSKSERKHLELIRADSLLKLPVLHDCFIESSPAGDHLCFALNLLGCSVETFREKRPLSVHIVKKIVADVLEALCSLHEQGLVHSAVTSDNFLFVVPQQGPYIHAALADSPTDVAHTHEQPVRPSHSWEVSRESFANASLHLSNLAHARETGSTDVLDLPLHLSPPEAVQGGVVDLKTDIWMLGHTAYFLLTGETLFRPLDSPEAYLRALMPLQDVSQPLELLENSTEDNFTVWLERRLLASETVAAGDIPAAARFLRTCLALDPEQRPTASTLIGNDWVAQAMICHCDWCADELNRIE